MASEHEQKTDYIEIPDDRSESERIYDSEIEKMEAFFANLSAGASVLIERIEPSWCKGVLEERTLDEDGLSLEYLIEQWGGKVLCCKVRDRVGRLGGKHRIPLYSYPPLLWGEPLERDTLGDKFRREEQPQSQSPVIVNPPTNQIGQVLQAALPLVLKYIESQQNQRQQDLQLMIQMMQRQNSSGLSDISKVAATMTSLKDVFGGAAPATPQADDGDFMMQAMDVLKTVMGNGQQTPAQPAAPALTPPKVEPPPKRGRGRPRKKRPEDNVTQLLPKGNVAETLAEMDPDAAVKAVKDSLSAMSPEKRDQTIQTFLQDFYADMDKGGTDG